MAEIQLRHLRYFLILVEERHFGRAAKRLYMAQPPLSRAIRHLEDELGVDLFERTSGGVTPTDAGALLAEEARAVLERFESALDATRRAAGAQTLLRLGAVPYMNLQDVQRFVAALRVHDPTLDVRVSHALTDQQLRRIRSGELDMGIFVHAGGDADIDYEPLFPGVPMAAYMPIDHPLAAKHVVTPADLRDEALVMFPRRLNASLYDWWLARLDEAGYRFREVYIAGGAEAQDLMASVAGGMGVGLSTVEYVNASGMGTLVTARSVDPPVSVPQKVVGWRTQPPRRLRAPIAAARKAARELRGEFLIA
jgi:DNA-binding transcriptional LysR family regulator